MATLEQSQTLLIENRAYTKACKMEVYALLKSPGVALWKEISLKKSAILLQMLNVSSIDLEKALSCYPTAAHKLSKHLSICDNEIGNQLADLLSKPDPDKALQSAQQLTAKCQQLEVLRNELEKNTNQLVDSQRKLREALSIQDIIPLTRRMTKGKASLFDSGLAIYKLLTKDSFKQDSNKTIHDLLQLAEQLATRFQHTDIPKLPRLAEDIFYHYLEIGSNTNSEVLTFLAATKERVAGELRAIHKISDSLQELKKKELPAILTEVTQLAQSLCDIISSFHHKKQLKENLDAVADTLEHLNIYHLVIKNKIGGNLEQKASETNSPINPVTIASRMTRSFFIGAKGLIRSVKMMVKSLKGGEGVNEVELQIVLETAINRCKNFHGTSSADIRKMRTFINELIAKYPKPFPYNDLFTLVKAVVSAYGDEVERYIKHYGIKNEFQPLTTTPLPSSMGQLTQTIIKQNNLFKKANSE